MADRNGEIKFHSVEEARRAACETVWYLRQGKLMPYDQTEEIVMALEHGAYREVYWRTYDHEITIAELETGRSWQEIFRREIALIAREIEERSGNGKYR